MISSCPDCTQRKICDKHVVERMRTFPVGGIGRIIVARKARWKTYVDHCDACGKETDWSVETQTCLGCSDGEVSSARRRARRDGKADYWGSCEIHGGARFATRTGKCLSCFRTDGQERAPKSPRAVARRAGKHRFLQFCEVHGVETEHWVTNGQCTLCYNAMGMKRPAPPPAPVSTQEYPNRELQDLTQAAGCTPAVFAELTGVDVFQVCRWLTAHDPIPDYAMMIARALTPDIAREYAEGFS